jgi:hypothetical protein
LHLRGDKGATNAEYSADQEDRAETAIEVCGQAEKRIREAKREVEEGRICPIARPRL